LSAGTLEEALRAVAARDPGKIAVATPDRRLSYSELDRQADRVAAGLAARGVSRGDRVLLALPNGTDMCAAVYGVARAGAAFSPVNPTIKRDKLAEILQRAGATGVLADQERGETVAAAVELAQSSCFVEGVGDVEADEPRPAPPIDMDLAAILFTSGSTGEPKGVALVHRNITFVTASIVEYLELGPEDRVLCVLPLSFGYGLSQLLTCVQAGATLVLEPGLSFPGRLVQLLEEEQITGLPGVPTVWAMLTGLKGLDERELPHLRFLTNAGAALLGPALAAVRRTFPRARLYSMYGQTECSSRVCYLPPEQLDERPDAVGVPIPGTEAWIETENGGVAPPGVVGELMVRGSHVMQGYWGDPDTTAASLRPGRWPWERVLATGDLFRADEEGYLYFVSRRDDIIKSRGEKVAPREVEEVLLALEGVREAAVVGVPDRLLGQAVHAHVSLNPLTTLEPEQIRRYAAERLEDHKVPRLVTLHDELPKTPNGKLDKLTLTAMSHSRPEPG
jgi:long-chain acyl-CoA synthetase